jgi:hypothetical protein
MVRSVSVRMLAVVFAAGSLLAISAVPAVAAPKVACAKATFKSDNTKKTSTSVISQCTNPSVSGGGAKLVANFANLNKITAKITWNNGKGVTNYTVTQKGGSAAANKCHTTNGKKDALIVSTGKFVSGTGAAGKALKGLLYKESLCVTPKLVLYLNPGSKITFG